ncbi:GDSL-type esterase/lipase family protein [Agreia pratensis]|uniref:GDSL-like Lipase/Acylhydrolase family protein n=1 Tax=Agreia pratensis TaxID=150121 RepID=A0A1X7L2W6_9MICO|nr:GDSL-type esterase/lipase family protein [Agreia pratensis]SMG48045.1 GDSL-like Lipase/Acylhydrolase family protein [Agreia pratensis]
MTGEAATATSALVVELGGGSVLLEGHLDVMPVAGGVRPVRLPLDAWRFFPPAGELLGATVSTASGVRIRFDTDAQQVELRVRCTRLQYDELPGPRNTFVAEVNGIDLEPVDAPIDALRRITMLGDQATDLPRSESSAVVLDGLGTHEKSVTVWFPQGLIVDLLDVMAATPVRASAPSAAARWIHHGSSISHCVETPHPTGTWPVVAARRAGLDLVNLGFGGQCMLDPFVADAIAAQPADVISLKVGINIVGARSMDQRTFAPALHGFLDRVRTGHPDTPIVLASSIFWPGSEDTPGPPGVEFEEENVRCFAAGDPTDVAKGALTLAQSRLQIEHVVRVREAAGENIHYLDGLALYGPDDTDRFTLPDGLHPDAALYAEMGARWAELAFGARGLVPMSAISGRARGARSTPSFARANRADPDAAPTCPAPR